MDGEPKQRKKISVFKQSGYLWRGYMIAIGIILSSFFLDLAGLKINRGHRASYQ